MSHLTNVETAFLNLRSQGYSYDKISKDLRVSKHTLIKWARVLQPKIDIQFRAAFKKYQTALVQRVEFLSQQFQTMTQLITTCDPKSSAFPRYFNILLKLHKSLEPFDVAPEPDSTESAPTVNSEPGTANPEPISTISAPEPTSIPTEHPALNTEQSSSPLTARLAGSSDAAGTKTAPESFSSIQNPERTKSAPILNAEPETLNPEPNRTESAILSYIEKYRDYFKKDPPEHVFRQLERARREAVHPRTNLVRQAS